MMNLFARIHSAYVAQSMEREEGQGVVEYSLVLGVIVVALFIAFQFAGLATGVTNAVAAMTCRLPGGPACV